MIVFTLKIKFGKKKLKVIRDEFKSVHVIQLKDNLKLNRNISNFEHQKFKTKEILIFCSIWV